MKYILKIGKLRDKELFKKINFDTIIQRKNF